MRRGTHIVSHGDGLRKKTGSRMKEEEKGKKVTDCTGGLLKVLVGWERGGEKEEEKGKGSKTVEEGRQNTNGGGGGRKKKGCEVLIFFSFSPV